MYITANSSHMLAAPLDVCVIGPDPRAITIGMLLVEHCKDWITKRERYLCPNRLLSNMHTFTKRQFQSLVKCPSKSLDLEVKLGAGLTWEVGIISVDTSRQTLMKLSTSERLASFTEAGVKMGLHFKHNGLPPTCVVLIEWYSA